MRNPSFPPIYFDMTVVVSLMCSLGFCTFPHAALSNPHSDFRTVDYPLTLQANSELPTLNITSASTIKRSDVTVQIINGDQRGSGILLRGQDNETVVVTNMHVVNGASQVCIALHNGKIFAGIVLPSPNKHYDLAFVAFPHLSHRLPFAEMYNSSDKELMPVVSSGYSTISNDYIETIGVTVSALQGRRLESGYSLTYSNPVEKGMSGGGVFSDDNKLVGINALHADPLWSGVWLDDDGKVVNKRLARRLDHLSVGIESNIIHKELTALRIDNSLLSPTITCPSRNR